MTLHSDVRIGSQRPAHLHLPSDRGSSAGVEAIELAESAGLFLDDWQKWTLIEALSEDSGGYWSAFEVASFVSRQNGKGSVLEARQLAGLFVLRESLQVHTSHEFKTTFEHYLRLVALIEGAPHLASQVARVRRGTGEQAIELKNGCRLRFLARSTGSGRGMSGDAVYLDEAYALTAPMMGALLPTLSAKENPQIWYTSSAARFTSEVMHGVIERGRGGGSDRLFYADWGLDAHVDVSDRENWYLANPALGIRISESFVDAEYDSMKGMPAEFARERLGVHEGLLGDTGKIRVADWDALEDPESSIVGPPVFALDVSPERSWSSIAAAGRRRDGLGHVEVFERRQGTGWVPDFVEAVWKAQRRPFRIDPGSPAGAMIGELRSRGVEVIEVSVREHAQGCGALLDAVTNQTLKHRVDPMLRAAVVGAKDRSMGDAWLWSRIHSSIDISPLVAVTLAWIGLPEKGSAIAEAHIVLV